MLKRTGSNLFVLNFNFLFANLKISYANENAQERRNRLLTRKSSQEVIRFLEDYQGEEESKPAFQLPLEMILQVVKNWQKALVVLFGRLRLLLGLPI